MEDDAIKEFDLLDPIAMYIIVRESLNMSIGKTAAQCSHASQLLTLQYMVLGVNNDHCDKWLTFNDWMDTSYRKIVLKADDKEWEKLKIEFKDSMVLIIDAGLTEILPNTETCIGLFPMRKSEAPKLLKRLQVLK